MSVRLALFGVASLAFAAPALAQHSLPAQPPGVVDAQGKVFDGPVPDGRPGWREPASPMAGSRNVQYPPHWEQSKADWLAECRSRQSSGRTVAGVVVGGLIGGVAGNRVAGRGDRAVGTIAGAAAGAAAGGAIGSSADKRAARDYCEAYLERNISYSHGQPVAFGYAPMTVMVPVAYVQVAQPQQQARECQETIVTEEWVPVASPPRQRYVPARPRPDKRVRIAPDKRVRVN